MKKQFFMAAEKQFLHSQRLEMMLEYLAQQSWFLNKII